MWVEKSYSLLKTEFEATFLIYLYLILLIPSLMLKIEFKLLTCYLVAEIDLFVVIVVRYIVCLIIRQFHLAFDLKWFLDLA